MTLDKHYINAGIESKSIQHKHSRQKFNCKPVNKSTEEGKNLCHS